MSASGPQDSQTTTAPPEIWGGAEYTCNRVGDRYFHQLDLSGHARRLGDLQLFSALGIQALRCGLLWERYERDGSWAWSDQYLAAVQSSGMRPIAGLMHHGSGPPHTSLLDPEFPGKLARYAGACAARYPWVQAWTPVNEPHTTARFSGLYGIWYPHHTEQASYLRALLHQLQAVVLSMRAIREVRSDAQLIQTDDLGRSWSTAALASTCDSVNERRWLTFDLLCGLVARSHALFRIFTQAGISEHEVLWFRDNPCPPAIVGANYYVTSDRWLDHRVELYPEHCRSAEGPFVDIEAVRARAEGIQGFEPILHEAYERYRLPVAVTEVHLGDELREQVRWTADAWHGALRACELGVPCVAFTFWSLLGAYFWNRLVTFDNGYYEPGVFHLRDGAPTPTELCELVRQCVQGKRLQHAALAEPGWWTRSLRIHQQLEQSEAGELVA